MSADHGVHCERCGTYIELLGGGPVRVCPSCAVVACGACWDPPRGQCVRCVSTAAVSASRYPVRGLAGARRVLGQLRALRTQLEELDGGPVGGEHGEAASGSNLLLLSALAKTLHADAHVALESTAARSADKAGALERELHDEVEAVDYLVSEIRLGRVPLALPAATRWSRLGIDWRRPGSLPASLAGAAAAILAIVVMAPLILPRLLPASGEADASESARAGALGGEAPGPGPATSGSPRSAISTSVTFDDWRMTAPLSSEWTVERGAAEQVRVAAYTSAVDRSLELTATHAGTGASVCRLLHADYGFAVDALVETPGTALLIAAYSPGRERPLASWLFSADPANEASTTAEIPATVGEWYHLAVEADAAGVAGWHVRSAGPGSTQSDVVGTGALPAAGGFGRFCAEILDGTPGGAALIDNLNFGPNP